MHKISYSNDRLKKLLQEEKVIPLFLIKYYDPDLSSKVQSFKRRLRNKGFVVCETYQGEIEKNFISNSSLMPRDIFDFSSKAAVFALDFLKFGVEVYGYTTLAIQINKFLTTLDSEKDIIFIHEIERKQNYPLQICFALNKKIREESRLQAIKDIIPTLQAIQNNLLSYSQKEIIVLPYDVAVKRWSLINPKFHVYNHGTMVINAQRVGKRFGYALQEDISESPYSNHWEYVYGLEIPEKVYDKALMIRDSYYQRLLTIDDIKRSIVLTGSAQVCVRIFSGIFEAVDGRLDSPTNFERNIGGHCVCVTGFDDLKKEFIFINSWGTAWGDNGKGYLPYAYLEHYLIEAWGSYLLFNLKRLILRLLNPKNIFPFLKKRLKKMKNEVREKIIERGYFEDKRRIQIKYEVKVVTPFCKDRGYFYVINFFDTKKSQQYGGWCHFSLDTKKKTIIIEELFIAVEQRTFGLGVNIIKLVEKYAHRNEISKVLGWVSLYDAFNEIQSQFLQSFFKKLQYNCIEDRLALPGSLFRFEKIIR